MFKTSLKILCAVVLSFSLTGCFTTALWSGASPVEYSQDVDSSAESAQFWEVAGRAALTPITIAADLAVIGAIGWLIYEATDFDDHPRRCRRHRYRCRCH